MLRNPRRASPINQTYLGERTFLGILKSEKTENASTRKTESHMTQSKSGSKVKKHWQSVTKELPAISREKQIKSGRDTKIPKQMVNLI